MYYFVIICFILLSVPIVAQTIDYVQMSIEFKPPLDRSILDRLENDTTDTWVNFIRVNYILYLDGDEIDPEDLKNVMKLYGGVKERVTIERRKK